METVKLKDITIIRTGKLDSNAMVENGQYPFFTCSPITYRIDKWAFDTEAVMLAGNNASGNYTAKYYKGKFNAYQRTYVIESKDQNVLNTRYLCYCINQSLRLLQSLSSGATTKFLTIGVLHNLEIPAYDIVTQTKIANIVADYDDLIEINNRQISLLEETAQRIYREWFVNHNFPDASKTPINEDGLPVGWKEVSISDNEVFILPKSKVKPFDGKKKYYATADVDGTMLSSHFEWIEYNNRPSRAAIVPPENSVWFARMSNSFKVLNCFGESCWLTDEAVISSGFCGFTSKPELYGFVYNTILSKEFDEAKNRYATGATQVSLTNDGLKKILIILPSIDLIQKYSAIVEPMMLKVEQLHVQNAKLAEARDLLLPRLLSGEIELENVII